MRPVTIQSIGLNLPKREGQRSSTTDAAHRAGESAGASRYTASRRARMRYEMWRVQVSYDAERIRPLAPSALSYHPQAPRPSVTSKRTNRRLSSTSRMTRSSENATTASPETTRGGLLRAGPSQQNLPAEWVGDTSWSAGPRAAAPAYRGAGGLVGGAVPGRGGCPEASGGSCRWGAAWPGVRQRA
jgi:hypothetical protein